MNVGWLCCTCRFKPVSGYYHSITKMLVHDSDDGASHGFCNTCVVEGECSSFVGDPAPLWQAPQAPDELDDGDTSGHDHDADLGSVSRLMTTVAVGTVDCNTRDNMSISDFGQIRNRCVRSDNNSSSNGHRINDGCTTVCVVGELLLDTVLGTISTEETYGNTMPFMSADSRPKIVMSYKI